MLLVPRAELAEHPLMREIGPEPLGNEFDAALLAPPAPQADEPQGRAARPACGRRTRQHLCLRSAVPGAIVAATTGRHARDQKGRAHRSRGGWSAPSMRCSTRRSRLAARRCATIARPPASSVTSSIRSRSMTAKARNARPRVAAALSSVSRRTDVRPSGARNARSDPEAGGEFVRHDLLRRWALVAIHATASRRSHAPRRLSAPTIRSRPGHRWS